ncbi:DUF1802 family protein [Lyngbya sp. PCC 8106]|uniref:DUF1802 family protein n=1 Tax=Lyngbya sp. (strain PCC 8106) TaxID=313612 RepID=UPI0000EA9A6C|nr:DUF1802 family protein [Lyngbya sp. PCC 8106]EAW34101.1 hypothetical protein L8106_25835 [Lyngbya sp. PCC 8106]
MTDIIRMIDTALCLPAADIQALIQGRSLVVIPRQFIELGEFALYADELSNSYPPPEQYYRSSFLPIAKTAKTGIIQAWAKCKSCHMIDDTEQLEILSQLTVWRSEALRQILSQQEYIFLAYLRVYLLPESIEVSQYCEDQFIPLFPALTVGEDHPILSNEVFDQRYRQILNRQPPLHPELEELQTAISQLAITDSKAKRLDEQIQQFLGWKMPKTTKPLPDWISTINQKGTAETGGKYEKGTAFENIVRQSLVFLGFEVDTDAKGGAGGMDLYCTKPYPMVGECKAGKGLGNMAVKELVELGGTHLGQETFMKSVKLVIGPGNPSRNLLKAAQEWKVSIINPMSLQKLVELEAKYPGSVNLFELKDYLTAGQIDSKVDEYIETVKQDIKLRSQIIEAVKKLGEFGTDKPTVTEIRTQYNSMFATDINSALSEEKVRELLIELSSPLTGYLGRVDETDRFYFLRELEID